MFFRKKAVKAAEYEVYSSCYDLPFDRWIEINISGDLKWLVKKGIAGPEELSVAWDKVIDEYNDLINDKASNRIFELKKEIYTLQYKLIWIEAIVYRLAIKRNEALISILKNQLGFKFKYDDLQTDLNNTLSQSKSYLVKLKLKQADYEKLNDTKVSKATKRDFYDHLSELAKFQGVAIVRPQDITVADYAVLLNRFKEFNKPQNGR